MNPVLRTLPGMALSEEVSRRLGNALSAYPWLLKQLEVGNPSGAAITFRMALIMVEDGTPGTANASLALDTPVAAGDAWRWEGEVALAGICDRTVELGFIDINLMANQACGPLCRTSFPFLG